MVARVKKAATGQKLRAWTKPWRVVSDVHEHVCSVEYMMTGENKDAHVARIRFYSDKGLHVTKRSQDILQDMEHNAEYHVKQIEGIERDPKGNIVSLVSVKWQG